MELRQIEYFVAVAEARSFSRGAEARGVGQPAVSQQVAQLERELGTALFYRTSRRVSLTEAGTRFLPEARSVLVAVERARRAALDTGRTVLQIGTSAGLGARLDFLLEALAAADPDIELDLQAVPTAQRLDRVRSGQLDAAFVRGIDSAAGLDVVPVWDDPLVVAVPAGAAVAGTSAVDLATLASTPLRITSRKVNAPLVDLVMTACAEASFEPLMGPRNSALQETLAAIGTGNGWTILYEAQTRLLRNDRVVFRPVAPPLSMSTSLVMPSGTTSAHLARLSVACAAVEATFLHHHKT